MAEQKVVICPYCGDTQPLAERCRACSGLFEPLSRQATHNAMGPWFVRDPDRPFQPGCSYETLLRLVERGRVSKFTIVRGPTTRQFWTIAKHVPGLSHLLGYCHQCDASVDPGDNACHSCGAAFGAYMDRNYLGLPEVQPLPWEAESGSEARSHMRPRPPIWRNAGDDSDGPRTISSFASDEELLGTGERGRGGSSLPASFGGSTTAADAHAAQEQSSVATAEAEETEVQRQPSAAPVTMSVMSHSVRRRLTQQQSTIRMLIAGMVVLGLLALTFMLGWFNAMSQNAAGVASPDTGRTIEPRRADERPRDAAPSTELLAGYERAVGLMDAAEDTERALNERIADYEQAVRLLSAIQEDFDPRHWPADLQQRAETARVQLDRLRLREFFP